MQLARILVEDLMRNKEYLLSMFSVFDTVTTFVPLQENSGEILITVLMKQEEIEKVVHNAVKEVFGNTVKLLKVDVTYGGRIIKISISYNCKNS